MKIKDFINSLLINLITTIVLNFLIIIFVIIFGVDKASTRDVIEKILYFELPVYAYLLYTILVFCFTLILTFDIKERNKIKMIVSVIVNTEQKNYAKELLLKSKKNETVKSYESDNYMVELLEDKGLIKEFLVTGYCDMGSIHDDYTNVNFEITRRGKRVLRKL